MTPKNNIALGFILLCTGLLVGYLVFARSELSSSEKQTAPPPPVGTSSLVDEDKPALTGDDTSRSEVVKTPGSASALALDLNRDLSDIRRLLLDCESWPDAQGLVRQLLTIGTPEAIGIVLEFMQDSDPPFVHKANFLADALATVDDPRIPLAAKTALRHSIEGGHDDWTTAAYATLIATKGDHADLLGLLEYVRDTSVANQMRLLIAGVLTRQDDPLFATVLLEEVKSQYGSDNFFIGNELAKSLVACGDPLMTARVLDLARDQAHNGAMRRGAYAAWGSSLKAPEDLVAFEQEWHSTPSDDREYLLDGLGSALETTPAKERMLENALPVIRDALLSGNNGTFLNALSIVGDYPDNAPLELAAILRLAADRAPDDVYRKRALALANDIEAN